MENLYSRELCDLFVEFFGRSTTFSVKIANVLLPLSSGLHYTDAPNEDLGFLCK